MNTILLTKNEALLLCCYLRQAERSVHYALSWPDSWSEFTAYYRGDRQNHIAKVIDMLKDAGGAEDGTPARRALSRRCLSNIASCSAGIIINRFKSKWSFGADEILSFSSALERLMLATVDSTPPPLEELLELRMDLFASHHAIACRLVGVREMPATLNIEHFGESKFIEHVSLRDLGVQQLGE